MSTETAWVIGLPADLSTTGLVEDIHSAAGRAAKAEPGDRLDIARFEALATRLEQAALRRSDANRIAVALPEGGPTILFGRESSNWSSGLPKDIITAANTLTQSGLIPVLVVAPHAHGTTDTLFRGAAEPPADTWEADEGIFGGRAVEARFRAHCRGSQPRRKATSADLAEWYQQRGCHRDSSGVRRHRAGDAPSRRSSSVSRRI